MCWKIELSEVNILGKHRIFKGVAGECYACWKPLSQSSRSRCCRHEISAQFACRAPVLSWSCTEELFAYPEKTSRFVRNDRRSWWRTPPAAACRPAQYNTFSSLHKLHAQDPLRLTTAVLRTLVHQFSPLSPISLFQAPICPPEFDRSCPTSTWNYGESCHCTRGDQAAGSSAQHSESGLQAPPQGFRRAGCCEA